MAPTSSSLPTVYFNHLYIVLDDKTYRAIQGSDYLRMAFPGVERRSTLTAAGETWYGTYFYCQDNYLEFFGAGNGPVSEQSTHSGHWQAGAQEGWAGLAFSTDRSGGAAAVREAVQSGMNYDPRSELRQLRTANQTINWFYTVNLAERLGLGSFDSWVMEYHPDIFYYKGLQMPTDGNLTRLAYLAPWNEERIQPKDRQPAKEKTPAPPPDPDGDTSRPIVPAGSSGSGRGTAKGGGKSSTARFDKTPPPEASVFPGSFDMPVFSRIIGATIHMDQQRAERYAEILALLGYAKKETDDGLLVSAHGFNLLIQPEERAPAGFRLSSLRLAMTRPSVAPMTFVFASRSRLVLREDLTAEWIFGV